MRNAAFFLLIFFAKSAYPTDCLVKESFASSGGYRELTIGEYRITDVESFKVLNKKVFFATSPIYGKPEIGVIDCSSGKKTTVVAPKNKDKGYPDGSDFFRIKEVKVNPKTKTYTVRYYYAPDVDKQDFKKFELKKNLKEAKFME